MNNIDTSCWKEFKISEILKLEKCKCGCASDLDDDIGDIEYIGAKKSQNGFMKFVNRKGNEKFISKGNAIVFVCDGEGSVGYCNYLPNDFIGSTTLMVGYNKHLNKYNGLFLVPIFDKEKIRYSYGRKYAPTLPDTIVKLPAKKDGTPDWDYMEAYTRRLWGGSHKTSIPYSTINFDILKWKEFAISELFEIQRGKLSNLNEIAEGRVPVVSAYGDEQGIQYYLDVPKLYFNVLTVSFNGSGTGYCSFHDEYINANSDCGILIPKFEINKYIGMFFVTLINSFAYKYSYGRKMTESRLGNEIIVLPQNDKGEIDYLYIETFIKKLQYSDLI